MAETVTVNTVDLMNAAWRLESTAGFYAAPAPRTPGLVVAQHHGERRVPRRFYEAGQIPLQMSVLGVSTTTGLVPGGSSGPREFRARVDELTGLFSAGVLTVDHVVDGVTRRAYAERATEPLFWPPETVMAPGTSGGLTRLARMSVPLRIPDAFWTDVSPTSAGPFTLATGATANLTAFAAATAPCDELVITFGPSSNPLLSQPATGWFVAYDGVIGGGQTLVITTTAAPPLAGTGGLVPDYTKLRYSGSARFFAVMPQAGAVPVVQLTHTGGGTAQVTIAGPLKYMTG